MKRTSPSIRTYAVAAAWLLATCTTHAQFKKLPKPSEFRNPPTLDTSIHVRDAFINRIAEDGFYCRLPAPAIVVADTPLFGEYEKNTDTLITPDWMQLKPDEKTVFLQLSGAGSTEEQSRAVFDLEAHHWILIVETVRWWEACKGLTLKLTPYQAELQATRVALAYWQEKDPATVKNLALIGSILGPSMDPIPPGQDFPTYFNQHFQTTATGKEYLWIQSQVVKAALAEDPQPSVVEAMNALK